MARCLVVNRSANARRITRDKVYLPYFPLVAALIVVVVREQTRATLSKSRLVPPHKISYFLQKTEKGVVSRDAPPSELPLSKSTGGRRTASADARTTADRFGSRVK